MSRANERSRVRHAAGSVLSPLRRAWVRRRGRKLFDADFYASQFPDQARPRGNLYRHFLRVGGWLGRAPHPLFDARYYLAIDPAVAAAGWNPFLHYLAYGHREGRPPHPLFDARWYVEQHPEAAVRTFGPLGFYVLQGAARGDDPHPLFDTPYYLAHVDDAAGAAPWPLAHYLLEGASAGVDPNRWFDGDFYFARYPDARASGVTPLEHYVTKGVALGYDPHPLFETEYYASLHPDVPRHQLLAHLVRSPVAEQLPPNSLATLSADDPPTADPSLPRPVRPLRVQPSGRTPRAPRLTVLLPSLRLETLTGGPNTAIRLGALVAQSGHDVRFVSTDLPLDDDGSAFMSHCASSIGAERLPSVEVLDAHDRTTRVETRAGELLFATAWWTAQVANAALPHLDCERFVYLIQDFEPLIYAASTEYLLALQTYEFPHVPIVNSPLLLEFLVARGIGRFADATFSADAVALDPGPDRRLYYPVPRRPDRPRRLLFYARPSAPRNLYELGLASLRVAARQGAFDGEPWEFHVVGNDRLAPAAIDGTRIIEALDWPSIDDWAQAMRESDVLLSLILSPHTGYAALEMAACGGAVVTNRYGPKDEARLAKYGHAIWAPTPSVEAVANALVQASANLAAVDAFRAAAKPEPPQDPLEWLRPGAERVARALS